MSLESQRDARRRWEADNREHRRAYRRAWSAANKDKIAAWDKKRHAERAVLVRSGDPLRAEVFEVYNGRCVYCLAPADALDHLVPVAKGGTNDPANLVAACAACNLAKGSRSLLMWMLNERARAASIRRGRERTGKFNNFLRWQTR